MWYVIQGKSEVVIRDRYDTINYLIFRGRIMAITAEDFDKNINDMQKIFDNVFLESGLAASEDKNVKRDFMTAYCAMRAWHKVLKYKFMGLQNQ